MIFPLTGYRVTLSFSVSYFLGDLAFSAIVGGIPQVDIDGVNLNEEVEVELENQQREGIIN